MKNRLLSCQALLILMLGFSGASYIQAESIKMISRNHSDSSSLANNKKEEDIIATIGIIDWNTVLSSSLAKNEEEKDIIATLATLQKTPKEGNGLQNKPNEKKLDLTYEDPETGLTLAGQAYIKEKNYKMLLQEIRSASGCLMMQFEDNKEAEKWSKESIVDPKGCAYGGKGIHKHVKN